MNRKIADPSVLVVGVEHEVTLDCGHVARVTICGSASTSSTVGVWCWCEQCSGAVDTAAEDVATMCKMLALAVEEDRDRARESVREWHAALDAAVARWRALVGDE